MTLYIFGREIYVPRKIIVCLAGVLIFSCAIDLAWSYLAIRGAQAIVAENADDEVKQYAGFSETQTTGIDPSTTKPAPIDKTGTGSTTKDALAYFETTADYEELEGTIYSSTTRRELTSGNLLSKSTAYYVKVLNVPKEVFDGRKCYVLFEYSSSVNRGTISQLCVRITDKQELNYICHVPFVAVDDLQLIHGAPNPATVEAVIWPGKYDQNLELHFYTGRTEEFANRGTQSGSHGGSGDFTCYAQSRKGSMPMDDVVLPDYILRLAAGVYTDGSGTKNPANIPDSHIPPVGTGTNTH